MPKSKPKAPRSKPKAPKSKLSSSAKPGRAVKPVSDLEPRDSQSENVRGGRRETGGGLFSDSDLKRRVTPLSDALAKLRELRS